MSFYRNYDRQYRLLQEAIKPMCETFRESDSPTERDQAIRQSMRLSAEIVDSEYLSWFFFWAKDYSRARKEGISKDRFHPDRMGYQ